MEYLKLFVLIYIIIFCLYNIYFYFRNKKRRKIMIEISYLEKLYKLNLSALDINVISKHIAIINSFIFTSALFIMNLIEHIFLRYLISFISIFFLVYICYKILSKYYEKLLK